MATFKVGDKVRRRAPFRGVMWKVGDTVCTVSATRSANLQVVGGSAWWHKDFFDLVPITLDPATIRAAAATSPEAEKALRVLAPEAFPPVPPARLSTARVGDIHSVLVGTPFYTNFSKRLFGNPTVRAQLLLACGLGADSDPAPD